MFSHFQKYLYVILFISLIPLLSFTQTLQAPGKKFGCDEKQSYCWYRVTKLPRIHQIMSTLETLVIGPYSLPDYKEREYIELGLNNTHIYWWFKDPEKRKNVLELCQVLDQQAEFDTDHSVLVTVNIYNTVDNFYKGFRSEVSGIWNVLKQATGALASGALGVTSGEPFFNIEGTLGNYEPAQTSQSYSYDVDGSLDFEFASRSREVKIGALLQKNIYEKKIKRMEAHQSQRVYDFGSLSMSLNQRVVYRDGFTATERETSGLDISANSVQINSSSLEKGKIRFNNFHIHTKAIEQLDLNKKEIESGGDELDSGEVTGVPGSQAVSMVVGNIVSNAQLDLDHGIPYVLYSSSLSQKVEESGKKNFINGGNSTLNKMSEIIIVITPFIIPKPGTDINELIQPQRTSLVQLTSSDQSYDFELIPQARENLKMVQPGDFIQFLKSIKPDLSSLGNPNALPELKILFQADLLRKEFLDLLFEVKVLEKEVSLVDQKKDKKSGKFFNKKNKEKPGVGELVSWERIEQAAIRSITMDFPENNLKKNEPNYFEIQLKFSNSLPENFKKELGGGCGVSFDFFYIPKTKGKPLMEIQKDTYQIIPCPTPNME